jgi:hypothetical protein
VKGSFSDDTDTSCDAGPVCVAVPLDEDEQALTSATAATAMAETGTRHDR